MTLLHIPLLLSCLFASPTFPAQSFETPHVKYWEASSVEQVTNVHEHNGDSRNFQPVQNVLDSHCGLMIIESTRYLDNIPPTHQIIYDFGETTFKLSDNATPQTKNLLIVKNGDDVKVVGVSGAPGFTLEQIDDYVALATKQGNQSKVMLGKTDADGPTGYVSRAGNDHAYFKMIDSQWEEALSLVNNNIDEMWKINKAFIDKRKALGNEFFLSHNPFDPNVVFGFYEREINYLTGAISEGGLGGTIVQLENNLWKIIF